MQTAYYVFHVASRHPSSASQGQGFKSPPRIECILMHESIRAAHVWTVVPLRCALVQMHQLLSIVYIFSGLHDAVHFLKIAESCRPTTWVSQGTGVKMKWQSPECPRKARPIYLSKLISQLIWTALCSRAATLCDHCHWCLRVSLNKQSTSTCVVERLVRLNNEMEAKRNLSMVT